MAKITVEYFRDLQLHLKVGTLSEKNVVEMLNYKAGEPDDDRLVCPHCNSTNTDVIHAVSYCECSNCAKEFEA